MILDAHALADGTQLTCDVCIVGGGAAGISVALGLMGGGLDVLLVESGGLAADAATQALYEGEVVDSRLHSETHRYRQRMFGGSSTIWGGRCVPYDPIDFERRDWIPHSDWPIGYADVLPFYPKANELCEAGEFEYRASKVQGCRDAMIEGFASPRVLTESLERFSCPTDFGRRYHARLSNAQDVRVLLHANAVQLATSDDGRRVERVALRTLAGASLEVRAGTVVLATGGLEVPRLLLASRSAAHPNGLGNRHDVVGRYYQCHLSGTIGSVVFDRAPDAIWHGYDVSWDGVYCRRRLTLTEDAQREARAANFAGRLHFPRVGDPRHGIGILSLVYLGRGLISYEYGKRLQDQEGRSLGSLLRHAWNIVRDPVYTVQFLWHWLRDRKLAARKFPSVILRHRAARYSLEFHAEQIPNPESRVTLAATGTDALGVPRIRVDWRYVPEDVTSLVHALDVVKTEIAATGFGRFEYDPATVEAEIVRYGAYGGHHIGTARMGRDPATSVVDADCRVHGVENLHVAGSAVFPTSSQANPTLTIVALALRLARHLRSRRAGSPEARSTGGRTLTHAAEVH